MRLLSFVELKSVKGIAYSKAHLHRLIKVGKFPRPIKIGANRNAWIEQEIDSHIELKIAERDASQGNFEPSAERGAVFGPGALQHAGRP